MEMPSIRQLECLVAVSETLNFRQAAEKCFISQPALSAQIKQLEQLLGVQLFERDKRRVLPTAAGKAMAEKAQSMLADLNDLAESSRSFAEPLSGLIRIGVIPTVAPYLLPKAMQAVYREFPNAQVSLREDHTNRLIASLEKGELDVLLLALEADLGDAATINIMDDPFWLTVPVGHHLAKRKTVKIEDLAQENILVLEDGHCLGDQAQEICLLAKAGHSDDYRASSLTTLVQMVAGGLGVTLLPEIAIGIECSPERNLKAIPFGRVKPSRTICLAYRSSSLRIVEYQLLADLLRRELA